MNMEEKKFIRVGTTLYKIVRQPNIRGGHTVKHIVWSNETLSQNRLRASFRLLQHSLSIF